MKRLLIIIAIACAAHGAHAQDLITWDKRKDREPGSKYREIEISDRSAMNDDGIREYKKLILSVATPALFDLNAGLGVTITATIAQAKTDLRRAVRDQQRYVAELADSLAGKTRPDHERDLARAIKDADTIDKLSRAVLDYLKYHDAVDGAIAEQAGVSSKIIKQIDKEGN